MLPLEAKRLDVVDYLAVKCRDSQTSIQSGIHIYIYMNAYDSGKKTK